MNIVIKKMRRKEFFFISTLIIFALMIILIKYEDIEERIIEVIGIVSFIWFSIYGLIKIVYDDINKMTDKYTDNKE